jgi:hypothetical protein
MRFKSAGWHLGESRENEDQSLAVFGARLLHLEPVARIIEWRGR